MTGNTVNHMATPLDDDDELFAVYDTTLAEDEDPGYEGPEVVGVPALFLAKLREEAPVWRSLGVTLDDTWTGYGDGRLYVAIDLSDPARKLVFATVRVEISETEWVAGWVSSSLATQNSFANTSPTEQTGGPVGDDPGAAVAAAVSWLEDQLRSPIEYRVWRKDGEVEAQAWRRTANGQDLVVSGRPETRRRPADETVQIRP